MTFSKRFFNTERKRLVWLFISNFIHFKTTERVEWNNAEADFFCFVFLLKTAQLFNKKPFYYHEIAVRTLAENVIGFLQGITNYNQFILRDFSKIHKKNLKKLEFFSVARHFHPSHRQPNIISTYFCAIVGLLLTKLNHYFNDCTDSNMFLGHSKRH